MRSMLLTGLLACLLWPAEALARWFEASSDHFVIYANDSERDVHRFAQQLERYHAGLSLLLRRTAETPSPSNRVTVYVVRDQYEVRKLFGEVRSSVSGFYIPRAGGSIAIVPEIQAGTGEAGFSMIVLLHEYAHHFMISASSLPMPRWFSEGAAEFFAASSFEKDGSIMLGRAAQHRAVGLLYSREVKVEQLLDPAKYERPSNGDEDDFYGKSWLLYHYLTFDEARHGQMKNYVDLLRQGKGQREAALEAFGDFDKLEKDLDRYLSRSRISALKLTPAMLEIGQIHLRGLSEGEAAMMPVRIQSRRGVSREQAKTLVAKAREIASGFPGDAAVLSALAEAEFDAGNDKKAVTAADAALAIDPTQVNAYVQKGYALFRIARDAEGAEERAAAYKRAREPFVALNRLENDHPLPLFYFYRSFVSQGKEPTPLAIAGLVRASQVAPFDQGLRMTLATTLIREGRPDKARIVLEPLAFNPHGNGFTSAARQLLDRLDSDPDWDGKDMAALLVSAGPDEEDPPADPPDKTGE